MAKKICILSFSDISRDSRVLREITMAHDHYRVDVIGYGSWQPPADTRFFRLNRNKRTFFWLAWYFFLLIGGRIIPRLYSAAFWLKAEYRQAVNLIRQGGYDLIHANDWDALPVAVEANVKSNSRVLFDAHEFSPEQKSDKFFWQIFVKPFKSYLFNNYLSKTDEMITVSNGIQELYSERFKLTPKIILNAPVFQKSPFTPVANSRIDIIHHGNALPGRNLEEMIYMIALTDARFHLNFMLISKDKDMYINKLKNLSQEIAQNKVHFWDPVSPSQIVSYINKFDLGLPFLKAPHLNILNALPNKFFDFIMAGLGVIISPLPAMAQIINTYAIGKISASQSAEDMALMLNNLKTDEINIFKRNALKLARELNAEKEMGKLHKIYQHLLGEKPKKIWN